MSSNSMKTPAQKRDYVKRLRPIDDVLFEVLAAYPDVMQEMLRVILEDLDLIVEKVIPQRDVANLLARAVRLDAWCKLGDGTECNVEVQRADNDDHLRRVRYNASGFTWTQSVKGTKFKRVPDVCIVYISQKDVLGLGKTIYHVEKVIRETKTVVYDGLTEIFVNATINDGSDIADLMKCFLQTQVCNAKFPRLSARMNELKNTEKGVNAVCTVMEEYQKEAVKDAVNAKTIQVYKDCIASGLSKDMAIEISGITEDLLLLIDDNQ